MRGILWLGLAVLLGVALGLIVLMRALLSTATSTDRVLASVELDSVYRLAVQATTADLIRTDRIARLEGSPLELRREDVRQILTRTFDRDYAAGKAREVHGGLVRHLRGAPARAPFRVSVESEASRLVRALSEHLHARVEALPPCPVEQDLEILWEALLEWLEEETDRREMLQDLPPDCRPPEPVRSELMSGIEEELQDVRREAPDSVRAFPAEGRSRQEYERAMRILRRADRWAVRDASLPIGLLAAGFILVAALHWSEPPVAIRRIGISLGIAALLCGLGGTFLLADGELGPRLFGGGEPMTETKQRWLALAGYTVERTAEAAGRRVLVGAGLLTAAFLAAGAAQRLAGTSGDPAGEAADPAAPSRRSDGDL